MRNGVYKVCTKSDAAHHFFRELRFVDSKHTVDKIHLVSVNHLTVSNDTVSKLFKKPVLMQMEHCTKKHKQKKMKIIYRIFESISQGCRKFSYIFSYFKKIFVNDAEQE